MSEVYTQEDFNRYYHAAILANTTEAVLSHETGHLRYEKRRGVVKTQEADCDLCVEQGLNDGAWHTLREITDRTGERTST